MRYLILLVLVAYSDVPTPAPVDCLPACAEVMCGVDQPGCLVCADLCLSVDELDP